jgi:hypothetical protein
MNRVWGGQTKAGPKGSLSGARPAPQGDPPASVGLWPALIGGTLVAPVLAPSSLKAGFQTDIRPASAGGKSTSMSA